MVECKKLKIKCFICGNNAELCFFKFINQRSNKQHQSVSLFCEYHNIKCNKLILHLNGEQLKRKMQEMMLNEIDWSSYDDDNKLIQDAKEILIKNNCV